ncbi:MAG TPA: hypothetical protein ENN51_08995, partial [candidate division WOR-3 bacterium]|nr:hypothetical protein [candidate division WOR-3 bacterium]
MLTALLTLTLIALPLPGEAPTALPFFGGAADGPDAAGYVIVPAETTGYAWIVNEESGVVRGGMRYGFLSSHRFWTRYAGFLRFALNSLPARTVITSVELDYYQYYHESGQPSLIPRAFNYNNTARIMIARIDSGPPLSSSHVPHDGWNRFTFGPTGIGIVDSCWYHSRWLAVGFAHVGYGVGHAYGYDAVPQFQPYLRIGYLTAYPDVGTAMLIEPADTVV